MNIIEEAERARRDLDKILTDTSVARRDLDTLTRRFEGLSGKLQTPGTKFLVELEYRLVYDATITVPAASATAVTVETLPGLLHSVYVLSAYCYDSDTPSVVCDGTIESTLGGAAAVRLQRTRVTGPPLSVLVEVVVKNTTANERQFPVRVWRRLGMGS